ncbi:MAG: ABC transporter substrate-binding protein [Proteobacteria bacterium]|nr:ABC transporter substrate-binding protein [Pseudomonadota bacterium]
MTAFKRRAQQSRRASTIIGGIAMFGLAANVAAAEVKEVRFARQLGLGYLQLYVMEEHRLVEKYAAAEGLGQIEAKYIPVGSPSAINDMLLSGNADYGAAGVPPFLFLWDKTRGNVNVRGVSALNSQPAYLNTNNPNIKSLRDFVDKDKIALPSIKVSFQAITLQMAAEQVFGRGKHDALDKLTVQLAHPEGTVALLTGRMEITGHFTSPPFQYQQLEDIKIHRVLSSYEITGPASFSALSTTAKFREANPKTYAAVLTALNEAVARIKRDPGDAARAYIKIDNSKLSPDFVTRMITNPEFDYALAPQNIMKFAEFMHRTGSLRAEATSWKDMFFPEIHNLPGS